MAFTVKHARIGYKIYSRYSRAIYMNPIVTKDKWFYRKIPKGARRVVKFKVLD